ncbi:hypothetical protein SAMN05421823_103188 [Catalinimonas alkaloidigena]|uniref:Peptidase M1 membrane alanine aminopeptidase domain-containing protein n=1 Tax=Catalinimonas alkaloidigena TaxID=1075417 RepID=A0A1G9DNB4_9BACT|nr:M1 family metallopeptidase [Catalinimonas alkaloidigena]SDK65265.1 hypothetical protein SAMN05421823_103188 [Catalinimonas alkaloidigena]
MSWFTSAPWYGLVIGCLVGSAAQATEAPERTWQQEANYRISATLDDQKHLLTAEATIEYVNHSPQTLMFLWIEVWPNAYQGRTTPFASQQLALGRQEFWYARPEELGWMEALDFRVGEQPLKWEYEPRHPDLVKVNLATPLKPGERVVLQTPFRVVLPGDFSRMGHRDQAYQLTDWYPQVAAYDAQGWHQRSYLEQDNRYAEFGSADVTLTLPKNYVVAATGRLTSEEEWAWLLARSTQKLRTDRFPLEDESPVSAGATKTIRFVSDHTHGFAWVADKRFNVRHGEVTLPSGQKVDTWAMFTNRRAFAWENALDEAAQMLTTYSVGNGAYAYPSLAMVELPLRRSGTINYPGLVGIPAATREAAVTTALAHQVARQWYGGMIGLDGHTSPWLVDGLAAAAQDRYLAERHPNQTLNDLAPQPWGALSGLNAFPQARRHEIDYLAAARGGTEQTLQTNAAGYLPGNYQAFAEAKAALAFRYARQYLGNEKYDALMRQYTTAWQFRHPKPADVQALFEEQTGETWDWLFRDLLQTDKKLDYAVRRSSVSEKTATLYVENVGSIAGPITVSAVRGGKVVQTKWYPGFTGVQKIELANEGWEHLVIDPEHHMPEYNRQNNTIELVTDRRVEPIRVRLLPTLEDNRYTQLFITPVGGYNATDKVMLGAAFYNSILPRKPLRYLVMPMWSSGQRGLTGSFQVAGEVPSITTLGRIDAALRTDIYAGYIRTQPHVRLAFGDGLDLQQPQKELSLRLVNMRFGLQQLPAYQDGAPIPGQSWQRYNVLTTTYRIHQQNALERWELRGELQNKGADFALLSATAEWNFHYRRKSQVRLRGFAGGFLLARNLTNGFRLGMSGSTDYLGDQILLDRRGVTETVPAFLRQRIDDQGGFRGLTSAYSRKGLVALNGAVDVPYLPISVFGDVGYTPDGGGLLTGTGLSLRLLPEILTIDVPLAGSSYADRFPTGIDDVTKQIRFTLHLKQLTPSTMLRRALTL